ncbi:SAM-dependent methyltransferase [Streptomyces sp. CZ24]|nr:SAM-dependent methyltransferase [Streptomyces sp. CZ24]
MTAPDATPDALTDSLTATRTAYDAAADTYAQLFRDSLRDAPLDRAMLAAFAEAVRGAGPDARVADLGCGPGHVTAHLAGLGLVPRGFDVSPAMIGLARAAHPELRFDVGSMAGLDLPDATLSGVLSRWSVIHTPPAELPPVLAEFARVLASRRPVAARLLGQRVPRPPHPGLRPRGGPGLPLVPRPPLRPAPRGGPDRDGPPDPRAAARRPPPVPAGPSAGAEGRCDGVTA